VAELRCPNCGKTNPDLLDVCLFCQTPLKPDSTLRIGDQPTKKNTGELQPILPDWLRNVQQQAQESAAENASQAANQPKTSKEDPLDFLAGLASQSGEEEEVPDWMAGLAPSGQPPTAPQTTGSEDFLSRLDKSSSETPSEPAHEEVSPAAPERDELSEWFAQASGQPEHVVEPEDDGGELGGAWGSSFGASTPVPRDAAPQEPEDLSWLRNLEEASKQTGDLQAPKQGSEWMPGLESPAAASQPASSQEDLSWLDTLGGIDEPSAQPLEPGRAPQEDLSWLDQLGGRDAEQSEPPSTQPARQEDLSWLNQLDAAAEPVRPFDAAPDKPLSPPLASNEDLSWLNNLGTTSEPARAFSEPAPESADEPFSAENLSWLNDLGGAPEPSQPVEARQEEAPSPPPQDLSWLKDFGNQEAPSSVPPFAEQTPLEQEKEAKEPQPAWLREATESPSPSTPLPGDVSMDWFAQVDKPVEDQPANVADIFAAPGEAAPLSNQDVDSLFSTEMPDWLSRAEPEAVEPVAGQPSLQAETGELLSPVDLPSWVQAMRPMEALISETPNVEDQPEETEGPLAGLRGVIPGASIGSAIRPKAISLKLQVTEEQQSSAALLEDILGSETSPRTLVDAPFVTSQAVLRWVLAGLFLLVLGAAITLRSQRMPVSGVLPAAGNELSGALQDIPANANVLVVIDYEPALAGEMEAIGAPILEEMVSLSRPNLSFLSTSPNGPALVERLLTRARINTPDGLGYQSGAQYTNLGFLPGGSAGVLGFVERPAEIIPGLGMTSFSDYAAVVLLSDHAESGKVWVEQLHGQRANGLDPALASQPLLVVASAQAGPLLEPYVSSRQITGMITGLSEAARYEASNGASGAARLYWDTFGIGLALAVVMIVLGSLWSLFTRVRARRADVEPG
jgi:hypothetical protein